jgi:MFS family permease
MFAFWREADPSARRAFWAASIGWMLDAFDVWIYALVLSSVRADLGLSAATAGGLQSLTLLFSALGGIVFGVLADRWGRVRALTLSVLLYSVFTAACGLAQDVVQLAVFRIGLGIGMGGEWASGAALVAETWRREHRDKAMAFMQSAWALGLGLAAIVNWVVQDVLGLDWRPPCSRSGCAVASPSPRRGRSRVREPTASRWRARSPRPACGSRSPSSP